MYNVCVCSALAVVQCTGVSIALGAYHQGIRGVQCIGGILSVHRGLFSAWEDMTSALGRYHQSSGDYICVGTKSVHWRISQCNGGGGGFSALEGHHYCCGTPQCISKICKRFSWTRELISVAPYGELFVIIYGLHHQSFGFSDKI